MNVTFINLLEALRTSNHWAVKSHSMPRRYQCTACGKRPGRRCTCPCGAKVGPGCCWDAARQVCGSCAGWYDPRRLYHCAECHLATADKQYFNIQQVQRVYISSESAGAKRARASDVFLCGECWKSVFQSPERTSATSASATETQSSSSKAVPEQRDDQ